MGKQKTLKVTSFTDESGQDTKGKVFVVCTVCIFSEDTQEIESTLQEIEKESGKTKKWFHTGNKRRHSYIELLLEKKILSKTSIFFSKYENKTEYTTLIGGHIAKAILSFAKGEDYEAKIFIDRMDNRTLEGIKKEVKSFHIRYKKIRGLVDESSSLIRLADTICGAIRDLDNKNVANSYRKLFNRLIEV